MNFSLALWEQFSIAMNFPSSSDLAKRRVFFVNRFYAPDLSATSQILTDIAEALAFSGSDVHVVASNMTYDTGRKLNGAETLNGVNVHRIWSTKFGRDNTLGRALDYITFYFSASMFLFRALKKSDIVVVKTDPPMLSVPIGLVTRWRRAFLVNWLQDVFPEIALRLGMSHSINTLTEPLRRLRNRSLKVAKANVVIGRRMAERVADLGISTDSIHIINNFVDDAKIIRSNGHSPRLREEWGYKTTDFIVGYSGNLGRAHDLDTVLEAARALRDHRQIKFLFIGGGFLLERLTQEIEKQNLNNIQHRPYQPRTKLPESMALPNLHWASLRPDLEGLIVPSKLYGIAAAGRPLLMVGDEKGEIGSLVTTHRFGECVWPGEALEAKRSIESFFEDPGKTERYGQNARNFIDSFGSKRQAVDRWAQIVKKLQSV